MANGHGYVDASLVNCHATSTRDHLLEAAAQKHVEAHKQVQAYAGLGMDVKQVLEASKSWEAL
eukprot:1160295-Pelagomonas_calceolata.AAC.4